MPVMAHYHKARQTQKNGLDPNFLKKPVKRVTCTFKIKNSILLPTKLIGLRFKKMYS